MHSVKPSVSDVITKTISPKSLLSWLFFGTKVFGGILLTITILIYANQDRLLYFPNVPNMPKSPDDNPPGYNSPGDWTVSGRVHDARNPKSDDPPIPFEDTMITTSDGQQIHTWLLLQDDAENSPTMIYFHGNAGNMGFRLQNAAEFYAGAKTNILMMDYRGYGKSTGTPNESGIKLDAEAVLLHVRKHPRLKKSPVVMFGRSLGGAVSFYLAEKFPSDVAGVIVENTFLSIGAMVDVLMPYLTLIKPFVLRIKWDNDEKAPHVRQPILFIAGERDELVPPFHMTKLFDLAKNAKHRQMFTVHNGRHNDTWERGGKKYYLTVKEFLDKHISGIPASTNVGEPAAHVITGNEPPKTGSDAEEDEDYLVVRQPNANVIPTMKKNFKIGGVKEE